MPTPAAANQPAPRGEGLRATCTANPEHDQFTTTAHVMEEWVVTSDGTFVESLGSLETTHGPDAGNTWTCHTCGAAATVTS